MNTPLRRLASVALVMCLALMGSATWVQVFQAGSLNSDSRNTRTLYRTFGDNRGSIVVGGQAVASSVPTNDSYGHQRQYMDPVTGSALTYSSITGYLGFNGSAGLERYANNYLSSTSDDLMLTRMRDILTGREPQGATVETTIVPQVQQAAIDALGGQQGAIVAIEPSTGKILALVSNPGFDPNPLASHDPAVAQQAYDDLLAAQGNPLRNKAYQERYPPGSTFKLIVSAAALESGRYTPDSMLYGPRTLTLPQTTRTLSNYGGEACNGASDQISLLDSLRVSCNTSFASLGMDLGADTLLQQAEKFGFTSDPNKTTSDLTIPMPVVSSYFPTNLDKPHTAYASIGQDSVQASPLEMAMVAAAIANHGTMMQPYLVDTVRGANLSTISTTKPQVLGQPISSHTADELTQMMEAVVTGGSGQPVQIPGVSVAAKTGTAQSGQAAPHVWFTGFAPADDPQVAVVVFVKNGGDSHDLAATGGKVAAPMAKQVIEAVLNR